MKFFIILIVGFLLIKFIMWRLLSKKNQKRGKRR